MFSPLVGAAALFGVLGTPEVGARVEIWTEEGFRANWLGELVEGPNAEGMWHVRSNGVGTPERSFLPHPEVEMAPNFDGWLPRLQFRLCSFWEEYGEASAVVLTGTTHAFQMEEAN